MGEYQKATWAYMIPVNPDGTLPPPDPPDQVAHIVYQIKPDDVPGFQKKFSQAGMTWHPFYSLQKYEGSL